MKTIKHLLTLFSALLLSTMVWATNVTLKVIDSGGNPISGVTINIHKSNCCSLPAIITGANGEVTVDLANYTFGSAGYVFTARLDYSSAAYAQAITSADEGTTIHTFQTAEARMQVTNCNGDPLVGIPLTYFISNSGGGTMGSTDANGIVTKELFTGTYSFRAFVNKTRKYVNVDISGSGVDYTYVPTQINFTFSGTISIFQPNIGGTLITPGIYLFPGTYNFKFAQSGHPTFYQEIAVSGCDMTKSVTRIEFLSSTGAPISGGVVRYWDYGNWRSAGLENGGVTDANGIVFGDLPAGVTRYRMSYYNTSNEVISTTSYVNFATINMEAELLSSSNAPLANGKAFFWGYGNWRLIGTTDATGKTNREVLSGNYKLRMDYKYTTTTSAVISWASSATHTFKTTKAEIKLETCNGIPLAGGNSKYWAYGNWRPMVETSTGYYTQEILTGDQQSFNFSTAYKYFANKHMHDVTTGAYTFVTTNVSLQWSGTIKYWSFGNHRPFTQPSMELLPGNYTFEFYSTGNPMFTMPITVSGCSMSNTLAVMRLIDSQGNGLAGGVGKYYKSGWKSAGTTDANGNILLLSSTLSGNIPFRMYWKGGSQQISQNITTNSTVVFQTELATAQLNNSGGTDLSATFKYYASGWKTFGTGTSTTLASMELLPINYPFRVYYAGASLQKSQDLSINSNVEFATVSVTTELNSSTGSDLDATFRYYASGWKTFGVGTPTAMETMELLPMSYPFRVYYVGGSIQKSQDVSINSNVEFATVSVTAELNSSTGSDLDATFRYYASGWKTFGVGTPTAMETMELLPMNYPFRVYYKGGSKQKSQNVSTDNSVDFATVLVTNSLTDCDGTGIAADFKYYASGWKTFGSSTAIADATLELLPINYPFRVYLNGASIQKSQNVSSNTFVDFTATNVTMNYPGTIKYYSSGWKVFKDNTTSSITMAMLAKTYPFRFYNGTSSIQQNIVVQGCSMENSMIYVQLQNSTGSGLVGGTFKYRFGYGSYTTIGTDNTGNGIWHFMIGNPTNTKVRVYYKGSSFEKTQNIQVNSNFIFNTVLVTADLDDSDGNPLTADSWMYRYGYGSYSTLDITGEELLPVSVKVRVGFKGTSFEKVQNPVTMPHFNFATVNVTADLDDSDGNPLTAETWMFRYGYGNYSTLDNTGEELLPVSVKVRVGFKGASVEKVQNPVTMPHFNFATVNVTADLDDSDGNPLTADTWMFRYGYGNYSTLDNTGEELLPVSVKVRVGFKGTSVEKVQNPVTISHFNFATVNVTANLEDSDGNPLTADTWMFRYGYGNYSTLDNSGEELLPVPVKVRVGYNSTVQEKVQDVVTSPVFDFVYAGSASKRDVTDNDMVTNDVKLGVYPNPFTDAATFSFELEETSVVKIVIYDLSGKIIKTVANGEFSQGSNQVQWNGTNDAEAPVAAGVYFYRIDAGNDVTTNRIILTR